MKRNLYTNLGYVLFGVDGPFPTELPISERFLIDRYNWSVFRSKDCLQYLREPINKLHYIPVEWLDNYGYTEEDLIKWITMIKLPQQFNLPIRYLGITKSEIFESRTGGKNSHYRFDECIDPWKCTDVVIDNNKWYVVSVEGAKRSSFKNYLSTVLIRYIYNHLYWDLPRVAMEIKEAVSECTNWEAIIMAHYTRLYYGYYSILKQEGDVASVFQETYNPFIPIEPERFDRIYDPNSKDYNLNGTFSYLIGRRSDKPIKIDSGEVTKFIKNKSYRELYEHFKKQA